MTPEEQIQQIRRDPKLIIRWCVCCLEEKPPCNCTFMCRCGSERCEKHCCGARR